MGKSNSVALLLLPSLLVFGALCALARPLQPQQIRFRRLPPKEFSAPLGSSITIECEAGGSPQPTIHWLKDGKRILQDFAEDENQIDDNLDAALKSGARLGLSATRSRLFIDCASKLDEATYTCVAETAYSRISSQTKFSIIKAANLVESDLESDADTLEGQSQAASANGINGFVADGLAAVPQCLTQTSKSTLDPVRIHMWTHNMVEAIKNNVVILCRSNKITSPSQPSQPSPQQQIDDQNAKTYSSKQATTSWTLPDDRQVNSFDKNKYEISSTGDLIIKDLQWSDMGSYICTVSDDNSSDSVSTFVYPTTIEASKPSTSRSTSTTNDSIR